MDAAVDFLLTGRTGVQGTQGDSGLGRDLLHGRRLVAPLREDTFGALEDQILVHLGACGF